MEVILRKTARLFEAGTRIAALVAGAPPAVEAALGDYGRHLGIAFQLVDDALDYDGDTAELGKNVGFLFYEHERVDLGENLGVR